MWLDIVHTIGIMTRMTGLRAAFWLIFALAAPFSTLFAAEALPDIVFDHPNYKPNDRLQAFYDALPAKLQKRIVDYRELALTVEKEVNRYNDMPRMGLPSDSFRTAQRRRMRIEQQMAALRLEQKAIAKDYYDLRATGWTPPNNSNIIRLLVANAPETEEEARKAAQSVSADS